jgi:hypothetical protein
MNLHPAIAAALVTVAPPNSFCHKLAAYHDLLSNLDWQYQFSDEHRIVKRGEELVARAHLLQAEVDPTGELWLSYSGSRQHGAPQPIVREVTA